MARRVALIVMLILAGAGWLAYELFRPYQGFASAVFVDLPNGQRQPRQYTVSSTSSARLQITVRRVVGVNGAPDGQVSSYLHGQARPGDVLEVSAPAGDFVVEPSDGPLLLATAGAGITTVLPIVELIARTQPGRATCPRRDVDCPASNYSRTQLRQVAVCDRRRIDLQCTDAGSLIAQRRCNAVRHCVCSARGSQKGATR